MRIGSRFLRMWLKSWLDLMRWQQTMVTMVHRPRQKFPMGKEIFHDGSLIVRT
jgi:hypothetical protein